jgi:pimeloyl-ACP methyl ester carboxylesterase
MSRSRWIAKVAAAVMAGACAHVKAKPGRLIPDVTFTRYSPLSRIAEIARRMLTPLTQLRGSSMLAASGQRLNDQAVDLSKEKFDIYLPAGDPPKNGYGLLVFVAPWETSTRPNFWRPGLDKHRLIFVSANASGNETKVYDRRMPLALLAYENVRAAYPVDPSRVYIGGLSGGSRVAEMTALGYPDVFRAALLNAGSDPIGGTQGIHLPPADLFARFQRIHLVYVTGEQDDLNLHDDTVSRDSMRDLCVFDVVVRNAPRLGHEPLDGASFGKALDDLERRGTIDEGKLAACNERLSREIAARLASVREAMQRGDRETARSRLSAIDTEYGGLAAGGIAELDALLR